MSRRVSGYLRRNVLGLVAIFLALNAGAYAVTQGNIGAKDLNLPSVSKVVQLRVSGNCTDGQSIRLIRRSGKVRCTSGSGGSQIASITGTDGLTGGGSSGDITIGVDPSVIQSRVTGSCPGNESVQSIGQDGSVNCGAKGTGSVTSIDVDPASGLTASPNPITTTGTLGIDFTTIQKRVHGSCGGNQAVQSVAIAGTVGCSGTLQSPVTGSCTGTNAIQSVTLGGGVTCSDTSGFQQRVTGTCPNTQAVQGVTQPGGVSCSAALEPASSIPGVSQATPPGGSNTLFDFAGILITTECRSSDGHAIVKLDSDGGAGTYVIYEVRSSLKNPEGGTVFNGNPAVLFADTGGTDQVTFNAASSGSPTHLLDGSLLVWSANGTSTGNCQYTGTAIEH